jgi:hypothetical protein
MRPALRNVFPCEESIDGHPPLFSVTRDKKAVTGSTGAQFYLLKREGLLTTRTVLL